MPTQDFVFPQKSDSPRHQQNMPEGNENPVPKSWVADRPGDMENAGKSQGSLFGHAGPNVGYAYTLVAHVFDTLFLSTNEHRHDVEPLLAEISMRRASHFGRAPIMKDVDCAVHLLSYGLELDEGAMNNRVYLITDCGHDEHKRRSIVNSIPDDLIYSDKAATTEKIAAWRASIKA